MLGTRVGEELENGERKVVESELQSYLGSSLPSQIPSKHFYSGSNQQNLSETTNLNGGGGHSASSVHIANKTQQKFNLLCEF